MRPLLENHLTDTALGARLTGSQLLRQALHEAHSLRVDDPPRTVIFDQAALFQ
jgi:hypothetical protein